MRRIISYIVALVVVTALAAAIITNSNSISNALVHGCYSSGARTVQQLIVDWSIYTADRHSAAAYETQSKTSVPNAALIGKQGEIRGHEADQLLTAMSKIAAVRIDVRYAPLLPKPLADVVLTTNFKCQSLSTTIL